MKAVVIGAGFGGLAAAIGLAARGMAVTVLEAGPRAGGKASVHAVQGVEFDTGPSLLTLPQVVDTVLNLAGQSLDERVCLVEHDRPFRYLFDGGQAFDVFHDPEATVASARHAFGARAGEQLADFLRYCQRIWQAAAPSFVFGPAPGVKTLLRTDVRTLMGLTSIDALSTMRQAIARRIDDPHLRSILMRYATYNGSDARCAPATLNCVAHVELGLGGFGVRGGMYEVVRVLERAARAMGVEFCFETPEERLEVHRGRVQGVVARGRRFTAQCVVSNTTVPHLFEALLGQSADPGPPSMSGWTAVVAASPGTADRAAHTVLMPQDYDDEFGAIFDRDALPVRPAIYACDQFEAHRRPGWSDGRKPLFVMVNAPCASRGAEVDFSALESAVRHRLYAAGLCAGDDPVVWRRTPAALATRFPGSDGAIYGPASNSPLSAFRRQANRVSSVGGLYVAGGGAHPGGGVPLCLLSGLAAVRAAVQDGFGHGLDSQAARP